MNRAIIIPIAMFVVGCISNSAIFELYSEKPIEIDCASGAIQATDGISKVQIQKHAIKFEGNGFSGELYHGGEGEPFTNYGMEIASSGIFGEDPVKTADRITDTINSSCGK